MTRYTKRGDYKELTSKLEVEMELLTEDEANEKPAAKARDSPNAYPFLTPPERPKTSFHALLNPWRSWKYIIWKRVKWIILTFLLILILALFILLFLYSFPTSLPSAIIEGTL